jgi:hypothetical protein
MWQTERLEAQNAQHFKIVIVGRNQPDQVQNNHLRAMQDDRFLIQIEAKSYEKPQFTFVKEVFNEELNQKMSFEKRSICLAVVFAFLLIGAELMTGFFGTPFGRS